MQRASFVAACTLTSRPLLVSPTSSRSWCLRSRRVVAPPDQGLRRSRRFSIWGTSGSCADLPPSQRKECMLCGDARNDVETDDMMGAVPPADDFGELARYVSNDHWLAH